MAVVLATPLGIAIGLYLSMMAPARVRAVVGPLVELLAAVPSIIYGLLGTRRARPVHRQARARVSIARSASYRCSDRRRRSGISVFTAGLVLTVMILPIISALSRDLFLTIPAELKDGAAALGATQWEVIRGIVLPTTVLVSAPPWSLGSGGPSVRRSPSRS